MSEKQTIEAARGDPFRFGYESKEVLNDLRKVRTEVMIEPRGFRGGEGRHARLILDGGSMGTRGMILAALALAGSDARFCSR